MDFEIKKVLDLKTTYIPGGNNKTKIDISSLNETDRKLLQYLLIEFYDRDKNNILDDKEQKGLYEYIGERKKINHEKLTRLNSICFEKTQKVKELLGKLHSLESWDPERKHFIISELGYMGSEAKLAMPDLKNVLIKDADMRDRAAWALTRMGPAAVPVFISLLEDRNPKVRDTAAFALGLMEHEANKAVPALKQLANNDEDTKVRKTAREAIDEITKKK